MVPLFRVWGLGVSEHRGALFRSRVRKFYNVGGRFGAPLFLEMPCGPTPSLKGVLKHGPWGLIAYIHTGYIYIYICIKTIQGAHRTLNSKPYTGSMDGPHTKGPGIYPKTCAGVASTTQRCRKCAACHGILAKVDRGRGKYSEGVEVWIGDSGLGFRL